jgi:quinohemoprotein ethanol dehydrogenase
MTIDNIPMAAPMTYLLDGVQYIAVNAGYGGGVAHMEAAAGRGPNISSGRLLVFKLGGTARLPPLPDEPLPKPPPRTFMTDADVHRGEQIYTTYCQSCHGTLVRGGVKDLRYMSDETRGNFDDIVLHGQRKAQGMASFGDLLNPKDTEILLRYITLRAYEDYGPQ